MKKIGGTVATTAFINDQPWETLARPEQNWAEWVTQLEGYLGERGWVLHRARLDGAEFDLAITSPIDGETTDEVHEIRIEAGPVDVSVADIEDQIRMAVPRFREELAGLGESFSRGEWRVGLERLTPLLEELRVVLTGAQLTAAARQEEPPAWATRVPPLLGQLSEAIADQSWVDVSDCLLYELVPVLEEWEQLPGATESDATPGFPPAGQE